MNITRDYSGRMKLDRHPSRVGARDYVDALNITTTSPNAEGVIANIVGNRSVAYSLASGTNKCIGAVEDRVRNRIIACIYNSNGFHEILQFNKTTRAISKIVRSKTDTGDVDILNFQAGSKIRSIDIVYRSEGDLVFINDAFNRPIGFNILTIGGYAPNITDDLIRLAKRPPLIAPTTAYDSDTSSKVNNHRKKLYQFKYRWVYKDGYKSAWSPISKRALPTSGYSIVTDTDPSKNNVVLVQVQGGGQDYQKIEIACRQSGNEGFGDFFRVEVLDRDADSIDPDATYTYRFYNDCAPIFLDQNDSDAVFNYVPDQANGMVLVNGNVLVFGGITEGYNQLPRSAINVQMSARMVDTNPNETPSTPGSFTYSLSSTPGSPTGTDYSLFAYVGAGVSGGFKYHLEFTTVAVGGVVTHMSVEYSATNSDDATAVRDNLITLASAQLGGGYSVQPSGTRDLKITRHVTQNLGGGLFLSVNVYIVEPNISQGSAGVWKWNSRYRFGLMYFDKYGKTNGVISYVSNIADSNDFAVTIPDFVVFSGNQYAPRIPVVTASISHRPPSWATHMQWVRTNNLSVSNYLQYATCQTDADNDYFYFCIENLNYYKEKNSGFVRSYQFKQGDRIRIMNIINTSGDIRYSESYFTDDYEILGIVSRDIPNYVIDGVTQQGDFIKVRRPSSSFNPYFPYMFVEIYTPAERTEDEVFYEFGECYPIYTDDAGNRLHTGSIANQTDSSPAQYEFWEGDAYFKFRKMYTSTMAEIDVFQLAMMDQNYAEFWNSAVSSNGRAGVVQPDMKQEFFPNLIRFSGAIQQGTNINALNRFYELDYDDSCKRQYGSIEKMVNWNNDIVVFQNNKIGRIPVLRTIVQYADGAQSTTVSNKLINPCDYYSKECGVGDSWESIAVGNAAIYWWDNFRGANCRLAQNGIDFLTEIYDALEFGRVNATPGRKIFSVFDTGVNKYISTFEAIAGNTTKTLVYSEDPIADKKGYETFASYTPEWYCTINNLLVAFANGAMWTFDSSTYNNFFGTQYDSYITAQFNDDIRVKKTFNALSYQGTDGWKAAQITSNTFHHAAIKQSTYINAAEFRAEEGYFHAAIGRDTNSSGGKSNGEYMKGEWATIKMQHTNASSFVYLLVAMLKIASSQKQP